MCLGEEASSLVGFFGVVGLQLRAGEIFVFSPLFVCFGLPCILPIYFVAFW